MAMLAEKRKRVRYCLNPNGNLWSNDNNKLGQKLLEKFGWTKGQGLGRNNQGITERIKMPYKFDSKGLGFKEKDGALQQQTEFQNLLEQFNEIPKDLPDPGKPSVSSLEEKSKKSKSRVHYQKFTRGKDISRYSSKDLMCILGSDMYVDSNAYADIPPMERNSHLNGVEYLDERQNVRDGVIGSEDCRATVTICNDEVDDADSCKNNIKQRKKKKMKRESDVNNIEHFQESENDIGQGNAAIVCNKVRSSAECRLSDTDSNEVNLKKKKHKKQKQGSVSCEVSVAVNNPVEEKPDRIDDLTSIIYKPKKCKKKRKLDENEY